MIPVTPPTATTPPASAPVAAPSSVVGTQDITAAAPTPPITETPQNGVSSIPQTPYTADNLSFQSAIQTPANNQATAPMGNIAVPQQPSSMLRILYIVGGVAVPQN